MTELEAKQKWLKAKELLSLAEHIWSVADGLGYPDIKPGEHKAIVEKLRQEEKQAFLVYMSTN